MCMFITCICFKFGLVQGICAHDVIQRCIFAILGHLHQGPTLARASSENGATSCNIYNAIMHDNFYDSSATSRTMAANNSVCEEPLGFSDVWIIHAIILLVPMHHSWCVVNKVVVKTEMTRIIFRKQKYMFLINNNYFIMHRGDRCWYSIVNVDGQSY